jgi:hypothetical protein
MWPDATFARDFFNIEVFTELKLQLQYEYKSTQMTFKAKRFQIHD